MVFNQYNTKGCNDSSDFGLGWIKPLAYPMAVSSNNTIKRWSNRLKRQKEFAYDVVLGQPRDLHHQALFQFKRWIPLQTALPVWVYWLKPTTNKQTHQTQHQPNSGWCAYPSKL